MRLVDAMTLRNGGTTSVTLSNRGGELVSYTVDHALPHDGRRRYVYRGRPFEMTDTGRLEIGCAEETSIREALLEGANLEFGSAPVQEFLSGGIKNPGRGKWFYALNFLSVLHQERCQPGA
jgi:hypothetical protein